MTEQKPFYLFPIPKKVFFTVAVRPDDPNECECAVSDCKSQQHADEDDYEEIDVYQCDCCGQWFCIEHINRINGRDDFCVACAKLAPGLRKEIEAFREELNK